MNNIFKIYKSDLLKITSSWVTLVIIIGITILPPIYAWINIYASWDPYGNTKGIKVAVINQDRGSNIKDIDIDVGSELISTLKTNDKIGWVFCDNADEGMKMVQDGDVYATIVIPEDFSLRLTTFLEKNPTKPSIEYYVNEKENAIAPKMTDAAATSIKNQISETIIETAVQKAFEKLNEIGVDTEDKYPQIQKYIDILHTLGTEIPNLSEKLDKMSKNAKDGIVKIDTASEDFISFQDTINKLIDFNDNFSNSIVNVNDKIREYSPEVRENLESTQTLFLNISNAASSLSNEILTNKPIVLDDIDDAIEDLNSFKNDINDVGNKLLKFNNENLDDIMKISKDVANDITKIQDLLYQVRSSSKDLKYVENLLYSVGNLCSDIKSDLNNLRRSIDSVFTPIDNDLESLENIFKQLESIISSLNNGADNDSIISMANTLKNSISLINTNLNKNTAIFSDVIALNNELIDNLESISDKTNNTQVSSQLKSDSRSLSAYITSIRTSIALKKDNINDQLKRAEDIFSQTSRVCRDARTNSLALRTHIDTNITNINSTLMDIKDILNKSNAELSNIQKNGKDNIPAKTQDALDKTDDLITKLTDLKETINDKDTLVSILNDTQKITFNIQSAIGTILNNIDDESLQNLHEKLANSSVILNDINNILGNTNQTIGDLSEFLKEAADNGEVAVEKFDKIKGEIPRVQENIKTISNKIDDITKYISFDDLMRFLKSNPDEESDFISSPVALATHSVYQMQNYGTGLTPFYSVLALWVGGLFLSAMLTTKAKNIDIEYTPTQEYFGKYLLFGTLAFLQGLITSLGDLFILGVNAHEPVLFVVLSVFTSLVFSMIIYSLVATLNNVGKAVAVIFLLLQITGSGGTFPIQVTPMFFQIIHKMLPFTYAISGLREAIFGVAFDPLVKDIGMLLLFAIIFTVYGRVFKKPLNRFLKNSSKELHQSGVVH